MNSNKSDHPVKTLVILLNMGGPQNKDEIHHTSKSFSGQRTLKITLSKNPRAIRCLA